MSGRFDDIWLCERLLVPDERQAAQTVLSLYKDKTLVESRSPNETLFAVVSDTRAAVRADASIEKNLQEQFGVTLDELAPYHREEPFGAVRTFWSFNHSWALRPLAGHLLCRPGKSAVLVHFDAHDDLASPMIGLTDAKGVFTAPVGESRLDLRDCSTIDEFILRGFIGIGSFIVPLLHAGAALDIVHVARDHRAIPEEFELLLEEVQETTCTGRRLQRPSVRVVPPSHRERFRYTRTSDASVALQRAVGRDLLLDIDLDYFCNAFDNRRADVDAEDSGQLRLAEANRAIDDVHRALNASRLVPSLVTVAFSPGFFPSDGWSAVVPRLRDMFAEL